MHDSGYIYLEVQQRDCLDDKNLYIIIHMIKERKDLSVQLWEIDWTLLADNDGCCLLQDTTSVEPEFELLYGAHGGEKQQQFYSSANEYLDALLPRPDSDDQ